MERHNMKQTWTWLVMATLAVSMAGGAETEGSRSPEPENPHLWKPQVTSVAVFKNGLGFFLRKGPVRLREGWCVAGEVPPAHFGTLAIYSHGKEELVDVIGAGPGEVVE